MRCASTRSGVVRPDRASSPRPVPDAAFAALPAGATADLTDPADPTDLVDVADAADPRVS
ncbi:hypothetical protein GCM10009549_42960 [Streptomyces thermoalcalitolerans]|uniref:Uncharacterized protein n=1 Tax=Streptomyces thermoalcalitolerans TaxID=65605 RepID=A0ABN1P6H0_9ACTN